MVHVFPHFVIQMALPPFEIHNPPCHLLCVCVRLHTYILDLSIMKWSCDLIVERELRTLMLGEDDEGKVGS